MHLSMKITSVVTSALLLVAVVAVASPASASIQTFSFSDCGPALDGQTMTIGSGDSLTVNFTTCTTASGTLKLNQANNFTIPYATFSGASGTNYFWRASGSNPYFQIFGGSTLGTAGSTLSDGTFLIYFNYGAYTGSFTVVVGSGSSGGGSSAGSGSAPAPVTQEFGKPASGTCDAAQPAGLDWAGVPSGGWANSWSQWMNGGTGGFVCTRTLVYSTAQGMWVLA